VFRRRRKASDDSAPGDGAPGDGAPGDGESGDVEATAGELDEATDEADDGAESAPPASGLSTRAQGPWDESETPDDDVVRLDLGGVRVPGVEGMEMRLDVDEASGQVMSVTVVHDESGMQLMAFAAPRTTGIWDDVRTEIRAGLASQGPVEEASGEFGLELLATLPVAQPDGRTGVQPVRFVGVDGPRWFLRGLFSGAAARNRDAAEPLEAVLRGTVVVRGTDPMAPGDPLALRMPTAEGTATDDEGDDDAGESETRRRPLPPPERGPEITEIR
jgi:hypothetical protein